MEKEKREKRKESIGEKIGTYFGCGCYMLIAAFIVVAVVAGIIESQKEKKRKYDEETKELVKRAFKEDSIKAHEAYINSPEYKDSVRIATEKKQRETIVFTSKDDEYYHFSTLCLFISDIKKLYFLTQYKAEQSGFCSCPECEDHVFNEDLIDYIKDKYSKDDIIYYFDIERDDLPEEFYPDY